MLTPHFQFPSLATRMADFDRCLARASTRLQPGQPFTARALTQDLTLRFMTTVLFGSDEDGHVSRIRARLTELMGFLHPMRRTLGLMLTSESSPIPFNPWPGAPYDCSSPERIRAFSNLIFEHGISAPVRTPRGRDIMAACGQLKSAAEKKSRAELDRLAEEKQAALG